MTSSSTPPSSASSSAKVRLARVVAATSITQPGRYRDARSTSVPRPSGALQAREVAGREVSYGAGAPGQPATVGRQAGRSRVEALAVVGVELELEPHMLV